MATKTAMAKAEKPAASRELTKAQWKWKEAKQNWVAYVMVAPYMIIFAMFTIVPVFLSIFMSFTDFNMLEMPNMVWMKNYVTLFFDDDIFLIAIKNTFIFAVIVGPSSYLMSFLVAWFINELPPKIRSLVTLVFYAPSISGQVYLIWGTLFSSDSYGWANAWLSKLGFIDEPINWFKDEKYVMPLCIIVSLWMSLGTSFLAFIAGLQGIDSAQYEAGAVDGVRNRWQELYYITLPNMKPMLMFGAVMSITSAFGVCDVPMALAGFPSTDYAAHTVVIHLFDYGFTRFEMGYASAIATLLFLVMILCNKLIQSALRRIGT